MAQPDHSIPKEDLFKAIRDLDYKQTELTFYSYCDMYKENYPYTGFDCLPFDCKSWKDVEEIILLLADRLGL